MIHKYITRFIFYQDKKFFPSIRNIKFYEVLITFIIIFSLILIWESTGITYFSILGFFKIIFLILFLLINLGLLYSEYLENKNKDNPNYIKNGIGSELKKIATTFISAASLYSAFITIKNEHQKIEKEAEFRKEISKANEATKKISDEKTANNFSHRLNLERIEKDYNELDKIIKAKSELTKTIQEKKVNFERGDKSISQEMIRNEEMKIVELVLLEDKAKNTMQKNIAKGVKFSKEVSNENNESKILEMINEKKSTIFDLDDLLANFDSLNGISKLACSMILSSSIILWCIFGIILNFYGNYLLDRFNLEERYPKIALFINYRRKVSKYYIMSNFLLIISMCLINVIFGISILSL